MENTLAIANFFIKKSLETGEQITPMKLIKLVYIAHGWYLGLTKEPLIPESVEAWTYGPVVPSIYLKFKSFGNSPITTLGQEVINSQIIIPQVTNEVSLSILNKVWDVYSKYSALQLSTITHLAGTPWSKTWDSGKGKSAPIPNILIRDHYIDKAATKTIKASH